MKNISKEISGKLSKLHGYDRLWNRLLKGDDEKIKLLEEIAASGEVAAIPSVAEFFVDQNSRMRGAASKVIHSLLRSMPVTQFPQLDQHVRRVSGDYFYLDNKWRNIKISEMDQLASIEYGTTLCGIASFHANGRIREAAVRKLGDSIDGSELPFLLIRLNDWVEPVRAAAQTFVRQRSNTEYAAHFLRNLPLVLRLESYGRGNHTEIVHGIVTVLCHPKCRPLLHQSIVSGDIATRRACVQLLGTMEGDEYLEILKILSQDKDSFIRCRAVGQFLAHAPAEIVLGLIPAFCEDSFVSVRREALHVLATRFPEQAEAALKCALVDSSSSMRATARYFLKRIGSFDVHQFYLQSIKSLTGSQLASAIRGLGESGRPEDAEMVRSYLSETQPRLQKAAIFALACLSPERFGEDFASALMDAHPGVSNEACKALIRHPSLIDRGTILEALNEDLPYFVRKNALKLLLHCSKWSRLAPLLDLCRTADERLSGSALIALENWVYHYNTSFNAPDSLQIREAEKALQRTGAFLKPHIADQIQDSLASWTPK